MSERVPMTKSGLVRLKDELKRLKNVERPKIVKEIAEARSHGDLSENAEYHAAKEKQSHLEGRILQVEDWIARAEVIDVAKLKGDRAVFGATVTLADTDSGDEARYQLVGELADFFLESGFGREMEDWNGDDLQALHDAILEALLRKGLLSPEELEKLLKSEIARWSAVIKSVGIKID